MDIKEMPDYRGAYNAKRYKWAHEQLQKEKSAMKNTTSVNLPEPSMEEAKELSAFLLKDFKAELLSEQQENNLLKLIQMGNNAMEELLKAHFSFVVSIAKLYRNNGLTMEELIAAGTRGFIQAARKYDTSKEFRFIHYATWWIRTGIIDAILSKKPSDCTNKS